MNELKGKKFVASYSSGKDSTLSIYKAIQSGMIPISLIMTYNTDRERSWFHGISPQVIQKLETSMNLPITLIKTSGEDYEKNFEKELLAQKSAGAEICVFGDIDLEEHLTWCSTRCQNTGLQATFPLWQKSRKQAVLEFLEAGFTTHITVVDTERMSPDYLGQPLTPALIASMEKDNIDVCGENGEYHTFVTGGPLFKTSLGIKFSAPILRGKYLTLEVE